RCWGSGPSYPQTGLSLLPVPSSLTHPSSLVPNPCPCATIHPSNQTGTRKDGLMARFHGVWPAMPSPVTEDFQVDVEGTQKVTNWLIENGVHGISALGSTGECAGLSRQQRRQLLQATVEAADGRVPVMGGANGTHFADVVEDLMMCAEVGAVGALTPPPFYYPLEERGVIDWFTSLADESPVPLFLYHIPRMTKVPISIKAVEELAQHPNIAGLKDSDGQL